MLLINRGGSRPPSPPPRIEKGVIWFPGLGGGVGDVGGKGLSSCVLFRSSSSSFSSSWIFSFLEAYPLICACLSNSKSLCLSSSRARGAFHYFWGFINPKLWPRKGRLGANDLGIDLRCKVVRNRSFLLQPPTPKQSDSTSYFYLSKSKSLRYSKNRRARGPLLTSALSKSNSLCLSWWVQ